MNGVITCTCRFTCVLALRGQPPNPAPCRRRAATTTCRICGGKQVVNRRESPPGSMLSTVDLELTSLINSDLTWKRASKGRSASRRTSKPISKAGGKRVAMPISESEKLGVSVLECRFREKAEHIPIKKRFFLRSPSPQSKNSSPWSEDTERTTKKQHALGLDFPLNFTPRCQLMATAGAADLCKIVVTDLDCDRKNLVQVNEFPGANEDFSGISILAAAACGSSMGGDVFEVGVSQDGASSAHGGPLEVLVHNESCLSSKELSMEDLVNSDKISTKEAGSCTFPVAEVLAAPSFHKGPAHGQNTSMPDSFVTMSQDLIRSNDDVTAGTHESTLRDDRSHWDLNTAMNAWEQPFECQCCSSQLIAGDGIFGDVDDGKHEDKVEMSKGCDLRSESDGINGKMQHPSDLNVSVQAHELNMEQPGFDSDSGFNGPVCLQEKLVSQTDLDQEVESVQNQVRIRPDYGSAVSVPVEHDWGSAGNIENLSLHNLASLDSCPDNSLSPNSNNLTSMSISKDDNLAVSSGIVIVNCRNNYPAKTPEDSTIPSISQAERQEATPLVSFSEKSTSESMDILKDAEIHERKLSLFGDVHVDEDVIRLGTGIVQSVCDVSENAVRKLDEVNFSQSSPTCAEIPRYEALLGGQLMVAVDAKEQHVVVSVDGPDGNDTPIHIDMGDLAKCSGKSAEIFGASSGFSCHGECISSSIDLVDHPGKLAGCGYDSDVSQDDLCPVADIEKKSEAQMDYDSHFEDGELRETIEYTWEDLGGEDGEAEHVDYGSDNRDVAGFGASDYHVMLVKVEGGGCNRKKSSTKNLGSEPEQSFPETLSMRNVVEAVSGDEDGAKCISPCLFSRFSGRDHIERFDASAEVAKETVVGPDNVIGDHKIHVMEVDAREANEQDDLKMKNSGCYLLPENRECSCDMTKELQDVSGRKNISCDYADVLNNEYTETRIAKSRTFKGELLPHIEGPVSGDVLLGKHRLCTQGHKSNGANDSNSRSEREFGSATPFGRNRYSLHVHSRAQRSAHWTDYPDGHSGPRRHNSSGYGNITGFSFQLPQNVAALFTSRQNTSFSSHDICSSLGKRRSPSEGDGAFGMRLAGEISPDRRMGIRERYLKYGRLVDKGSRGRYDQHVLDVSNESALAYSHPLAKREKGFSPIERRGDPSTCRSHTKSPSRSRSHSPNTCQSPRGRNGTGVSWNPCLRHRRRSPSFRSGARLHRIRSPHRRSSFVSDHMVGLMPMPRNRVSLPHNSRWIGNRKDGPVYFREHGSKQRSSVLYRRSPGRICPRDERFDLVDPLKWKPNEYCRSMRPRKFSVMDEVARGPRYAESDDDRKKQGCRNGLVQPVRRYEMDRSVKRFRYDIEDGGFVAAHSLRKKDGADLYGRSPKDHPRGIDSRIGDIPRRSREEKGPLLSTQDAKYNADS